jgi:hypothetical protein
MVTLMLSVRNRGADTWSPLTSFALERIPVAGDFVAFDVGYNDPHHYRVVRTVLKIVPAHVATTVTLVWAVEDSSQVPTS